MDTLILALPGAERLAASLAQHLQGATGAVALHRFPDGEAVVRLETPVAGKHVLLAAHLDHPDDKTLPLVFAADAARELGATRVGLVAPYLPYMRQDERFRPGEAVTSRTYARLLSGTFDFLVTVDPHLHRLNSLDAIYRIPSRVVAAAPAIADWLRREVPRPLIVGPDAESEQWVADVARRLDAPFVVMTKVRHGDRDVQVQLPAGFAAPDCTPVLLDDIASSGQTLVMAARVLRAAGCPTSLAVAVHALLDASGMENLRAAGVTRVVSCDTVLHETNGISIAAQLAEGVRALLPAG
jgi:ribose-phosphate pyrophosphokinase